MTAAIGHNSFANDNNATFRRIAIDEISSNLLDTTKRVNAGDIINPLMLLAAITQSDKRELNRQGNFESIGSYTDTVTVRDVMIRVLQSIAEKAEGQPDAAETKATAVYRAALYLENALESGYVRDSRNVKHETFQGWIDSAHTREEANNIRAAETLLSGDNPPNIIFTADVDIAGEERRGMPVFRMPSVAKFVAMAKEIGLQGDALNALEQKLIRTLEPVRVERPESLRAVRTASAG